MDFPTAPRQTRRRIIIIKLVIAVIPLATFFGLVDANFQFLPAVALARRDASHPRPSHLKNAKGVSTHPVAFFRHPAPPPLIVPEVTDYRPSALPITISQVFRGSHQILVYADHEQLQFSFDKVDLNRYRGLDILTAKVRCPGPWPDPLSSPEQSITIGDDGFAGANGPLGKPQPVHLSLPVYRPTICVVNIIASEDVLLTDISSPQHLVAFQRRVFFAEGPAYTKTPFRPITMTTNSTTLAFSPNHYPGKQDVSINGKNFRSYQVRQDQISRGLIGETSIMIPKGDIIFTGDGQFAVSPSQLIPTVEERPLKFALSTDQSISRLVANR